MTSKRKAGLLILLFMYLFVQFIVAYKITEPYPAIVFPGFGDVPATSGYVVYKKPVCYVYTQTGDSLFVDYGDLLNTMPVTYQVPTMQRAFSSTYHDMQNRSVSFTKGTQALSVALEADRTMSANHRTSVWLKERLTQIVGRNNFSLMKVFWVETRSSLDGGTEESSVYDMYSLELDDAESGK